MVSPISTRRFSAPFDSSSAQQICLRMIPGQMEVQCGTVSLETPLLSISTCVRMRQAVCYLSRLSTLMCEADASFQLPRCQKALKASCIDTFDNINCDAAGNFCSNELNDPFFATGELIATTLFQLDVNRPTPGLNPYDVSKVRSSPPN